ncbi:OmpA family protein [uncultured Sulfitobacter sp.]|uniref:OmpA family protein n=1 Tax=uncultured Sulfitobacter sp. TaxID=191468 RepID=UPI00260C0F45|nr:OmpA family protein [uncultured Sulfitobacter sp.]
MKRIGWALAALWVAGGAQAVELHLPTSARQMITRDTAQDRYELPVAPFADGHLPTQRIVGAVARSAWRIDQAGLTPLQVLAPLRTQLEAAGFTIVLDCAAAACGGYDFRFGAEVLPAPNMYVNIRNYHALSALRGEEAVNILASASSGASFVQIIQAGSNAATEDVAAVAEAPVVLDVPQGSMSALLQSDGYVVLAGLDFESGTSELGAGPFDVLAELAETLAARPQLRIALVGHTDNVGSLDGNIALSRNRAASVRARLVGRYGVTAGRLEAQGMGYLAPHTTNSTEAGRETNRRVEAVVLQN